MPSTKTVSPRVVRAAQALRNEGKSWAAVGKTLGRTKNWASKLLDTYDGVTGFRKQPRKTPRSPLKADETAQEVAVAFATAFREFTHQDIANSLRQYNLADISASTVRRILKKRGFRKANAVLDTLTPAHKVQRVKWCQEMKLRLAEEPGYFNRWWITDEMRVALDEMGRVKVQHTLIQLIG